MKTKIGLLMALTALLTLGSGCALLVVGAAAGAGAGTVIYIKGELHSSEAVTFERAGRAAESALKDLGYAITDKKQDTAKYTLIAYGAGGTKITVTLEKTSATVTDIGVRVGTFGDETLSRQIMDKIKSRL